MRALQYHARARKRRRQHSLRGRNVFSEQLDSRVNPRAKSETQGSKQESCVKLTKVPLCASIGQTELKPMKRLALVNRFTLKPSLPSIALSVESSAWTGNFWSPRLHDSPPSLA